MFFILIMLVLSSCAVPGESRDLRELIGEMTAAVNDFDFKINESAKSIDSIETFEASVINPLTGEPIPEIYANKRPCAVVFNNLKKATPQSGISESEIFYEVEAEGGITRIIGYAHKFSAEKIGPIRSARDYFFTFAEETDAFFIHHGGSPLAYNYISKNGIDNLDGIAYEGVYFYRDLDRARERGLEHSSYISAEAISEGTKKFRPEAISALEFNFGDAGEALKFENAAAEITIPFSGYQTSKFVYSPDENIYYRFQNDEPHLDEYYGVQLGAANILVQFADSKVVDDEGRMDFKLTKKGAGYLFSGGKYIAAKWEFADGHTKWFDDVGNDLVLSRGKTWIAVLDTAAGVTVNE
jgi:hypothetical protein